MNCPKCGVELLEHVSFCPLCGSALPDDLWQKKKAARARAPVRKRKKTARPARPNTVTMRPAEPGEPKTVTMKPVDDEPKTVTMRPTEPAPPEPVAEKTAPGRPQARPGEGTEPPRDAPQTEAAREPPEPKEKGPASGDTVDMLCPMCDSIVTIPVERPIHVKCPKCSEEYYFAK